MPISTTAITTRITRKIIALMSISSVLENGSWEALSGKHFLEINGTLAQ
jgi:hypothetical protein